jgi:AraC-like DNA-binding protein
MFNTGTTRVGGMKTVISVVEKLGFDHRPIIRHVGLTPTMLSDPDFIVPSAVFGRLFAHCVEITKCEHFGLLVGAEGSLSWMGRVGFIARNSENIGEGLRVLGEYFYHHDRSAVVALDQEGEMAVLSYTLLFKMEARNHWLGGVMCCGVNIMRELCTPGWAPAEVRLAIPRPSDQRPYERFFRAKLTFDAPVTALVFDAKLLGRPIANAQPELRRILLKDIENSSSSEPENFPLDVMRIVRANIGTGHCSADKISALLGISVRALSGKLEEHKTSFKQIVENVRFEMAKQMMENTDMPLRDISELLDYSEISAFTRAFTRWAGTAPGNWRRSVRASGGMMMNAVLN